MTSQQIAQTILNQLGGPRVVTMTGAKYLTSLAAEAPGLMFMLPTKGKDGSNKWRITLTPMDTYHVETFYVRSGISRPCSDFSDIYADQLVALFEKTSGLYTKL
jgi:hypothetical protein